MKNLFKTIGIAAFIAVIGCGVIACNNGNNSTSGNGEPETGDISGLVLESGAKPVTLANHAGKSNVIKVDGKDTAGAVVQYPLKKYKGKLITIEFSADVRREGAAGDLSWQVNNDGTWPSVAFLKDAPQGVWHNMRGRCVVTPANAEPCIYLTTWENNSQDTVYYIANVIVTIT